MSCASCGHENRDDARFCDACGAPLAVAAEVAREERKVVTVLFADLVGFTSRAERMDPEDVRRLLAPYWSRLRGELERFGGTVEKFIGDAVMAVFGAPRAHEDDAERAVRAALAIRDWALADEQELQLRIGIATGEALVAVDARPTEGEGIASGDVVNTAARLQSAAPVNGILVGEATHRVTAHAIDYRELDPVEVKGKAEPVVVWEALEARSRIDVELARPATALVGRRRELDQLFDAFDRAREERAPQLVTVVGVPGIGKSRLVGELYARVDADPDLINWRQGRSHPYGEGVAFSALADMVKAEAGILDSDSAEAAEEKLLGSLEALPLEERERDWIEQSLRPLVGIGGEARGGDRRVESFAAWRRYLEARAELRPHVLIFEDLHWADDDLLDFVDELADWIEGVPVLVLCTARPELLERRPGWGGGKRNALTISLAPLSEEDTARLIGQLLERPLLPADEQAELLARIGGNPLFAEQFVRVAAERGPNELPETLHGIIAARLDSLTQGEKALLQDAAVFGRVFWGGAFGAGAELDAQLQQLVRKEFIRRERRSVVAGEAEFSFAHALMREVAYGQIPRAQRAERHEAAAAWIEALGGDRLDDRADQAAHHYLSALELRRAAGLDTAPLEARARVALRQAAERASALGSNRVAVALWTAALDLCPEGDSEYPSVAVRKEVAVYDSGDAASEPRTSIAKLEQAAARLLDAGDREQAAEAIVTCSYIAWYGGLGPEANQHLERAVELVRDRPASPSKAIVLSERARRLMLRGDHERARPACVEALEVARNLGLPRVEAEVLITLGALTQGDEGERILEDGVALAVDAHDPGQITRGYNNLAEHRLREGSLAEIGSLYEEARDWGERFGARGNVLWFSAQQAGYLYIVGEWDRALDRSAEHLDALAKAATTHYLEGLATAIRGEIRFARGETEAGLADMRRAHELSKGLEDPQAVLPSIGELGRILLLEGKVDEARALTAHLASAELSYWNATLPIAWLLTGLGEEEQLLLLLDRADDLTRSSTWGRAAELLARGDATAAGNLLDQCGGRVEAAFARWRAAEQLGAQGRRAEANEQLALALAFFRSVGAVRYTREAERLLAQPA